MKSRYGVLLSCATGALLIGLGPITSSALAADLPVKAPVVAAEAPWWTHGFIEFGGRGFLNDPAYGGHIWQGQGSLAKFYEYKTEKPGPFGDFNFATGSANGLYQINAWGYNPGYSDQAYDAYFTKAGEHYLDFHWDETPHVYSTSASTLFNTNGNALTLINPNFGSQARTALGVPTTGAVAWPGITAANAPALAAVVNSSLSPTTIGIRRDTASVDYRWTPTDNWDIKFDYSNMRRTGSQVDNIKLSSGTSGVDMQVAKPIADTTQNFGVNGEYIGVTPWGKRFNVMAGYFGSVYTDDFSSYTVQNPFCVPNGAASNCAPGANTGAPLGTMSTPPSNSMNAGTGTIGMDLPLDSRYMGTVTYSSNTQNAQFLPFSSNPAILLGGVPATSLSLLPAQSLNGQIDSLLVNNVLTTQWNPDLKTKIGYRYYDYNNQTPQIGTINAFVPTDASTVAAPVNPLMLGYIRQNGVAEVVWRPVNSVNLGSSYNYERYDFTRFDASSTNENTGKVFADWKPARWLTFRTSANFGERRASNYDYLGNVGLFQWPTSSGERYSEYYRQLFLDDRNRTQAKFQVDIDVLRNLTVSPTFKWQDDQYLMAQNQVGLYHDRSLAAGVELGYAASTDVRFLLSYMNEQRNQLLGATNVQPPAVPTGTQLWTSDINDRVNTVVVGVNYAVIPSRFDLGLTYTWSYATNTQPVVFANGTVPQSAVAGAGSLQYPEVSTTYQRLEATAKYVIDPDFTHSHGIPGQVALKLRYAWERNSVTNWNNDLMQPYLATSASFPASNFGYMQWLAGNNPNYNVQLLAGSVSWAW